MKKTTKSVLLAVATLVAVSVQTQAALSFSIARESSTQGTLSFGGTLPSGSQFDLRDGGSLWLYDLFSTVGSDASSHPLVNSTLSVNNVDHSFQDTAFISAGNYIAIDAYNGRPGDTLGGSAKVTLPTGFTWKDVGASGAVKAGNTYAAGSWSMVAPIPEPIHVALGIFGGMFGMVGLWRSKWTARWRKSTATALPQSAQ